MSMCSGNVSGDEERQGQELSPGTPLPRTVGSVSMAGGPRTAAVAAAPQESLNGASYYQQDTLSGTNSSQRQQGSVSAPSSYQPGLLSTASYHQQGSANSPSSYQPGLLSNASYHQQGSSRSRLSGSSSPHQSPASSNTSTYPPASPTRLSPQTSNTSTYPPTSPTRLSPQTSNTSNHAHLSDVPPIAAPLQAYQPPPQAPLPLGPPLPLISPFMSMLSHANELADLLSPSALEPAAADN
eukprot:gene23507-11975_t